MEQYDEVIEGLNENENVPRSQTQVDAINFVNDVGEEHIFSGAVTRGAGQLMCIFSTAESTSQTICEEKKSALKPECSAHV